MKQVFIRKMGDELILSPRPSDWSAFLASNDLIAGSTRVYPFG